MVGVLFRRVVCGGVVVSLTAFLRAETTVQRSTVLVAWALVSAVSATVWHFEVVLLAGGVGCRQLGAVTNSVWYADGCTVWHGYLYLLLAVTHTTFFYLLWR